MDVANERSSRVVSYAKLHRASVRRAEGLFLVEGANSVAAAIDTGRAQAVLIRDTDADRHDDLAAAAHSRGVDVIAITDRAADKLSETTTTPGIFAVSELLDVELGGVLDAGPRLLAVAVEPREPGNAGTLIRTADAMGANAVVLLGDSVDPHNGKCVRSSAGSVFHIPLVRHRSVVDGLDSIRAGGIALLATAADGEVGLDAALEILAQPTAWLFGNEAHGLSGETLAAADHRVSIPIYGRAESLNLAAAASICLYESARIQSRLRD